MSSEWADQTAPGAASGAGQVPAVPVDTNGVPGRALAAQREAMGWSVEQVADQLKMAVRQVIALEAGDYASLPGPAVVRGFVRAYAKVVKLDPVPLVAMIALDSESAGDTTPRTVRRDKPASFSEVRFPTNGKRSSLPLGLIAGAVVIAGAAAAAWHFGLIPRTLMGSAATPASPAATAGPASAVVTTPATGAVETTLVKPGDEMKPLISPGVPLISVPPVASATVPPPGGPTPAGVGTPAATAAPLVAPAPAAPSAAPLVPAAAAPAAPSGALVLNVRQDAWIDLRTTSGKKLFSGLVKGGTVKPFDISGPVTLKVGNAAGVDATLRGTVVPLPATSGTVAKVNLQ